MDTPTPRQINRLLLLPALVAVGIIVVARGHGLSTRAVGQDAPGASVIVDAFPDLAGEGAYWPDCPGCDGAFRAGDALLAEEDPLPALQILLTDESGSERLLTTRAMSEGRQQAIFELDAAMAVTVSLGAVPEGWATCPERRDELMLDIDDFEDGQARLEFALSPTCRPPGTAVTTSAAKQEAEQTLDELDEEQAEADPVGDDPADDGAPDLAEVDDTDADDTDADDTDASDIQSEDVSSEVDDSAAVDASVSVIGSVSGIAFLDANQDGRRDAAEVGLPDVQVYVDGESETSSTTTDADGAFSIGNLDELAYDVSIAVPEGLSPVAGDRYARLAVAGRDLKGVDFALTLDEGAHDDGPSDDTDSSDDQDEASDEAGVNADDEGPWANDDATDPDCPSGSVSEACQCDDPYAAPWNEDAWMPWGGLPSTGLAGVTWTPGRGLAGVALLAGLLGMVGLALERRRGTGGSA
jgi:hypothetical protein